jgi:hypothetical protein
MSQENVEVFKRGVEAYDLRDIDTLLEDLDPDGFGRACSALTIAPPASSRTDPRSSRRDTGGHV